MSGESAYHIRLVETLVATVRERHSTPQGIAVFADHREFGVNRPPTLGGYTPDVFACDVPSTFRVVGEAKTKADLETDRSHRQLRAFLDHLSLYPNSTLYIAVPWVVAPRARFILKSLRDLAHQHIRVDVISCA
jgi:hypothetical protein